MQLLPQREVYRSTACGFRQMHPALQLVATLHMWQQQSEPSKHAQRGAPVLYALADVLLGCHRRTQRSSRCLALAVLVVEEAFIIVVLLFLSPDVRALHLLKLVARSQAECASSACRTHRASHQQRVCRISINPYPLPATAKRLSGAKYPAVCSGRCHESAQEGRTQCLT
jgi:hypothetical protein